MKIYVMRHGQTDWNVKRKIQGCTDIELNENGIKQAEEARSEFNKYNIDFIVCSPLKRTRKTAEIINKDKNVPIIIEEKVKERAFGDYEGANVDKIVLNTENNFWERFWDYKENTKESNVEPVVDCCQKVWGLLDDLKEKHTDKNILIVTHGGTAKIINSYFCGFDENGCLPHIGFKNCEIREYKI